MPPVLPGQVCLLFTRVCGSRGTTAPFSTGPLASPGDLLWDFRIVPCCVPALLIWACSTTGTVTGRVSFPGREKCFCKALR